ncbi:hypothetical protein B0A48_16069 [Cryoendolithus antarcticus]|uniref:Uncharacterized protein n=1 Tax=Cryoendolithus antarcticus TaxID=1507870 RepID=A0A1V8SF16_9PEZI|nr:hypothetical protein B0A48_16069 [Cryoendolithus antarcticus]
MEELDELDERDDDALEEVEAVDKPYTGGTIALEDVDVRMLLVIGTTGEVIDEVVTDVRAMLLPLTGGPKIRLELALLELLIMDDDLELDELDDMTDEVMPMLLVGKELVLDAEDDPYIAGTADELEAALEVGEVTDLEDVDIDGVNGAEEEVEDDTGGRSVAGGP